ncbi:TonB-dependent receptor [Parabacteroides sp. AM58-2XD]|uniref:outer membrane beta-barrel family protein n=1 Tax=Parabacteroides TaxID=375288 RepID=UPI000FE248B8|nr:MULTISPECIES: outer membrane beta-barrel family protein [Parabacteroides]RGY93459.1 TonB-dependent receptor [Parabacteroides sp. AM58-2XD]GKG71503.1 TonB-dependent receptor [Parabacteroides goldsteinii]GKG82687.1 TonB-dependent receptor [Parabacteroides goldsteinii]
MKEKLLYLVLVLMMTVPLCAQNQNAADYTIKGQVVDSLSNETVPYATLSIALANAPQKAIKLLACDDDGKFTTTLKQPGTYIMSMQSLGKLPAVKRFTLSEGKNSLNLGKLFMNDDTQQINEVTVVAQKPLVTVEVDKITYSLDDDPEAKTNNALEMFRKVPMITVDGEDKIQLKGSSNYKIYMNGKPSNLLSGENASDVLKSMPASSIKNIEVITDPGSKYDAEGVGGIINIITSKNAMQGYTGTVRANASTLGSFGGGGYVSLKVGNLGLTANYGYNNRNSPWNNSHSERETEEDRLAEGRPTKLIEDGRSKYKGPFQYGYLEASYEIDTLNLISVGANLFRGKSKNLSELDAVLNPLGDEFNSSPIYKFHRNSVSEGTFGSTDVNVDYQHSTFKKDELLTVSYRFSQSPNDSESNTELSDVVNYYLSDEYPKWNINDASTIEHTGQVDYTTPLFNKQTLEAGVKYINRQNKSNTLEQIYNDSTKIWEDHSRDNSQFRHTQHIYSAYLGYVIRLNKFGIKAGVRGEGTSLKAEFARKPDMDFSTDYFDVVPNATLTYQIDMSTQIRLGYNMRIQRPGIWYLNPYINDVDPQNISQGNPNLDSEKSNNVNLNFSKFTQKFSINASLSYTFVNNPIERYSFTADFPVNDPRSQYNGAMWNTYDNIGKKQQVGMFLYGNWSPNTWFRIYMNGGLDYTDMKAPTLGLEKDGISGRVFAGTQFTLPKDFRINLNGGYFSPWIMLQGKQSPFYFAGLNVSKDFLKKKLSVSVGANNPFWKTMKMEMTTTGEGFRNVSTNWRSAREFRFSISYRFGTMKGQIKKVRRGISNDDSKGGGENNQGGGEQSM